MNKQDLERTNTVSTRLSEIKVEGSKNKEWLWKLVKAGAPSLFGFLSILPLGQLLSYTDNFIFQKVKKTKRKLCVVYTGTNC